MSDFTEYKKHLSSLNDGLRAPGARPMRPITVHNKIRQAQLEHVTGALADPHTTAGILNRVLQTRGTPDVPRQADLTNRATQVPLGHKVALFHGSSWQDPRKFLSPTGVLHVEDHLCTSTSVDEALNYATTGPSESHNLSVIYHEPHHHGLAIPYSKLFQAFKYHKLYHRPDVTVQDFADEYQMGYLQDELEVKLPTNSSHQYLHTETFPYRNKTINVHYFKRIS